MRLKILQKMSKPKTEEDGKYGENSDFDRTIRA
jgi:hypothetical protein